MKMTESMKSEAVRLYFEENREEAEIASAARGISLRQAKTVLGDLARLETYKKRSRGRQAAGANLREQERGGGGAAAGGAAGWTAR